MAVSDGRNRTHRDIVPGFAGLVKARREELQLSRLQLSTLSGVGTTTISCIELEWRTPSLRVAMALARALNLDSTLADPAKTGGKMESDDPPRRPKKRKKATAK